MKFRFKYLVAGTLVCLTSVSSAAESSAWGWQEDSTSLQTLLGGVPSTGSPKAAPARPSLLPRPTALEPIQRVGYFPAEQDGAGAGTASPLAPKPFPIRSAPAALVPIRSQGAQATALPAPIVSVPISPQRQVPRADDRPATSGAAPIIAGPLGGQTPAAVPIITSPLAPNISRGNLPSSGSPSQPVTNAASGSSTRPGPISVVNGPIQEKPAPPVIVSAGPRGNGSGATTAGPSTVAPSATTAKNTPTLAPSSARPSESPAAIGQASTPPSAIPAITPPANIAGTTIPAGPSIPSAQTTGGQSTSPIATSPIANAADASRSGSGTSGMVGLTSQSPVTSRSPMDATETGGGSDEIEVAEISPESLAELMQAFGVGSSINAPSSDLNQSAKKRVSAIGTGAMIPEKPITEIGVEPSMGQDLMAGDGVVTESRVIEGYGLNLGHERPAMPTQLPYDGYGTISGASTYLLTDFLYMQRDGGDFSVSYAPQLDGYEFSPGIRLTYGNRWDSIEGYEVGVTLLETQTSHTSVASPTNSLFSWLQPRNGFDAGNLSSFNNASFHHSFHKGHYHAADFNRVNWNWDVMSTFIGLRYTGIDEMYALHSVGGGGDLGAYRLRARNHMFGPQVGGSLHYDVGRKLSFSLTAKIAGYANFYQTDTEFANNSVRLLDIQDSRADLAWGTELAFFTHLRLTPRARIRGGWELWFYDQIASSRDQLDGFVSPFSGVAARNGDEALFYGFSLGLEWFR